MGEFRKRILRPLSFPLVAAVFVGALVISLSRVLLAVPEQSSTLIALVVAVDVLGIAAVIAATRRTKPAQRTLMVVLGPLMVLQYGYWRLRRGRERTTWAYLQSEPLSRRQVDVPATRRETGLSDHGVTLGSPALLPATL